MPVLFSYLFKFSLSLGVVYLFYQLVLRRLTFYTWNRFYLLGYTLLCLFIPFINITPVLERNNLQETKIIHLIPGFHPSNVSIRESNLQIQNNSSLDLWQWMLVTIITGIVFMLLRFFLQLYSFYKMQSHAKFVANGEVKLYEVNQNIAPFSFGKNIFINRELHTEDALKEIIRHEIVHVRERHTIDVIWGEILCILCWYNPFVWLIRKSIRQNLEFIADNKVLQSGIDKKQYQYLLLKVIGNNHFSIAQNFNFSSLKKRIAMMNKMKSAKLHLVKFLFVLPVIIVMLLAFRNRDVLPNPPGKTSKVKIGNTALPVREFLETHDTIPVKKIKDKNIDSQKILYDTVLWVLDGKVITADEGMKIDPKTIAEMRVSKGADAILKYNLKGKSSVIEIITKKQKTSAVNDSIPVNDKGYILDVKNENDKDFVVVIDKENRVVKEIPLLQWNERKRYYESIYGKGVDKVIESAVEESMVSLGAHTQGAVSQTMFTSQKATMRERVNGGKVLRVIADTLEWKAVEGRLLFKGQIKADDIIGDIHVQADALTLDWAKSYVLINGKELDLNNDYTNYNSSDYWIITLSKEEAIAKYGTKAERGAVEIFSR